MWPDNLTANPIGWKLALASLLFLFFVISLFGYLDPKRPIIDDLNGEEKKRYFSTDTTPGYGPGKLFQMLGTHYQPGHFDAHRRFIKYDLGFAVLYAAAAAIIIVYLQNALAHTPGDPSRPYYLWLAPLIAGAFDILEGVSMWCVLNAYKNGAPEDLPTAMALVSSAMTMGKILFLVATFVLLITGGAALVLKKVWHLPL
ncbi:MAG: hypothetical protein LC802_15450 [Acidobacteria bacterium]|nr:hypothetical protein [Acidobacteriota bacterium]